METNWSTATLKRNDHINMYHLLSGKLEIV